MLPQSTLRDPKKPISHQVRQIYGGCRRRGSGSAAQEAAPCGKPGCAPGGCSAVRLGNAGLEPVMVTIKLQ